MKIFKKITAVFLAALMLISFPISAAYNKSNPVPPEEIVYYNDTEYRGEGMVVAVIDKSFNLGLDYWVLADESMAKITEETLNGVKDKLNAGKYEYHNAKIPFVYNYTTKNTDVLAYDIHGTHIAGLIGANDKNTGDGFNGIVPEAQLLFMCVFDDTGNAYEPQVKAAIEDAVTLGADVINLSAGINAGFDDGTPFNEEVAEAILAAEAAGVSVVCAAGNSGNNFGGSYYNVQYGINLPLVSVIDNGMVATPASMEQAIAVGSISSYYDMYSYITLNDENKTKIKITDTTLGELPELGGSFLELLDGKTLEYEVISGLGAEKDYEGIDVTGKLALIERGEILFSDKIINAGEAGAVGAIIYNNTDAEGSDVSMIMAGASIPAVFISMNDGLAMVEMASEMNTVIIADTDPYYFPSEYSGIPMLTSSVGPTPGLKLKPDVMAAGEDILSLASKDDMRRLSGTSMSTGYVSGITAMLKQYLRENEMPEDPAYIRTLIINSAVPSASVKDDIYFSPRIQGGGSVDIDSMLNTEVLLTGMDGRAKIELGGNLKKSFKIEYTITNTTDEPITAVISAAMLTDGYVTFESDGTNVTVTEKSDTMPYFINDTSVAVTEAAMYADKLYTNVNMYSPAYREYTVELEAGESRDLAMSVTIKDTFIKNNSKIFTEGFFLDGYIFAEVAESGSVSSIPFMGFYGDWANLPVVDNMIYDGNSSYFALTYLYTYIQNSGIDISWICGANAYNDEGSWDSKHIAFSPNFDGAADYLYLSLALLRSAYLEEMTITDSNGKIIDQLEEPELVQKTILATNYYNLISALIWTGDDGVNELYILPDGEYTLTLKLRPVYDGAELQTFALPFMLDTELPELASYDISNTDEGYVLSIECTDNHCIPTVAVYDTFAGIHHDLMVDEHDESDCGEVSLSINIENFIENGTRYLYVDIYDYAFNCATVKIDLIDYID